MVQNSDEKIHSHQGNIIVVVRPNARFSMHFNTQKHECRPFVQIIFNFVSIKTFLLLSDVVEIPLEMVKTTAMEYGSTSDLVCLEIIRLPILGLYTYTHISPRKLREQLSLKNIFLELVKAYSRHVITVPYIRYDK